MSNQSEHAIVSYNGISETTDWPPDTIIPDSGDVLPVPYLSRPPDVLPIDVGRQLFVDDFLIQETTMRRVYHVPVKREEPVLTPQTTLELNGGHCPMAAPFNDGAWYDDRDGLYKLWYQAGWFDGTALAVSTDGIHWERPDFGVVPGTNAILKPRPGYRRDGGLVWLDRESPETERYKMFLFFRSPDETGGELYRSADGVHWEGPEATAPCGDNTSFFYNSFRKRYVFSIREGWSSGGVGFRARAYHEAAEFIAAARWAKGRQKPWARADRLDKPEKEIGDRPQLYDVNAVAYESILIGAFAMFYGPQNPVCARIGRPKTIDLQIAYSRDGFHWHRPDDRPAFIPCSRRWGSWDYGYIHAAGGVCLIVGDALRFYFGAFSGKSPKLSAGQTGAFEQDNAMYAGASTGMAEIRRDGFASMDACATSGFLLTKALRFKGRRLFVNIDAPRGELRGEACDLNGNPIEPFTMENCIPIACDSTRAELRWKGVTDLSAVVEKPVRFRFTIVRGSLYSFWVSDDERGASNGYIAAGGPGLKGSTDTIGGEVHNDL